MSRWKASLVLMLAGGLAAMANVAVAGGLEDYVKREDPSFKWSVRPGDRVEGQAWTDLDLTSQTWRGIPWTHRIRIYEPGHVENPGAMVLVIAGGRIGGEPRADDAKVGEALSKLCGARVAFIYQIPNQPLLGDRVEDDLISETFVNYLKTKEADWPLLFPMVKSAVRAMDACQQWAEQERKAKVEHFVVTGASKRGWTTWLTSAMDPRVIALAPMVIDTLNMKVQIKRQKEVWGFYSEQIEDYTRRGLTESFDTPDGEVLWTSVDPYSYRHLIKQPKLLINGANDRYWTLGALNIYWGDLVGPKAAVYQPNAGHNLKEHFDYALHGIAALFRLAIAGKTLPVLDSKLRTGKDGTITLDATSEPRAKSAQLWQVKARNRDYRESLWEAIPMESAEHGFTGTVKNPAGGNTAVFGDLVFEIGGFEYHLSTLMHEVVNNNGK